MDRQWHQYLRIPIIDVVDTTPPPWCHLGTLPLDSLPPDEHVDWQALKLISTSCQISDKFHFAGCQNFDQFHFEAYLLFGSKSSPQYEFLTKLGIEFLLFFPNVTHQLGKVQYCLLDWRD